jgi:hypothetical protein
LSLTRIVLRLPYVERIGRADRSAIGDNDRELAGRLDVHPRYLQAGLVHGPEGTRNVGLLEWNTTLHKSTPLSMDVVLISCPIIIAAMMFRTAQYADALAIAAKRSCASNSN